MVYFSISETAIQNRIQFIIDIINDASSPEPVEQRLNQAWHELFGMQFILSIADTPLFSDVQAQCELDQIRKSVAQALADVACMYDEEVGP